MDVTEGNNNFEHMLVNTVQENFKGFTKHKVEKAKEARHLQGMIGNPTKREYTGIVHVLSVKHCRRTKNNELYFLCKWRRHVLKDSLFKNYET